MEIRQPVIYEIARLSDGEVVFEYTLPGEEQWATREASSAGGVTHGGMGVIFGRTAVSAVTDRYAYLATTDSITFTRSDEAGTTVEVSFEQPREHAEAAWVRFVRDTTQAHLESIQPGQIVIGGRNFMMHIREFRLRLLKDLPARSTLPSLSDMKGGADGLLWIREYPDPLQDQVAWVGFNEGWERKKRLVMPPRLHVLDISEDRVLVRAKGALDETLDRGLPDRALNTDDRGEERQATRGNGAHGRVLLSFLGLDRPTFSRAIQLRSAADGRQLESPPLT